jgi:hypothetical protein
VHTKASSRVHTHTHRRRLLRLFHLCPFNTVRACVQNPLTLCHSCISPVSAQPSLVAGLPSTDRVSASETCPSTCARASPILIPIHTAVHSHTHTQRRAAAFNRTHLPSNSEENPFPSVLGPMSAMAHIHHSRGQRSLLPANASCKWKLDSNTRGRDPRARSQLTHSTHVGGALHTGPDMTARRLVLGGAHSAGPGPSACKHSLTLSHTHTLWRRRRLTFGFQSTHTRGTHTCTHTLTLTESAAHSVEAAD